MVDQELKLLIKKRGCVKGRLTIFQKFVDGVSQGITDGETVDKVRLIEIESRLGKVEKLLSEFDEYQRAIEISVDDGEFENQLKEREEFESSFEKLTSICKRILTDYEYKDQRVDNFDNVSQRSRAHSSNTSYGGSVVAPNMALSSRPKLPSIPIPKFNGALENWLEFRDTFQSMIHNNESMGTIEKFHFLRSALEGEAKEVIQGLEFSADSYLSAWELLCERFNNPVSLINNHLKSLFELSMLERESASDLRQLVDSMIKHLRAIQNFGQSIDTWDIIIIFMIRGKLDWKTRREWDEIKPRNRHATLEEFKKFLLARLALLQEVQGEKNDKQGSSKSKSHKSFLVTNLACLYCKKEHFVEQCERFLKLNTYSRYMQAKKLKVCLNCLKRANHFSRECEAGTCGKCGAKHHTLLHYEKRTTLANQGSQSHSNSNTDGVSTNGPSINAGGSEGTTVVKSMFCGNGEVLLSTALIQALDGNSQPVTCRALLDTGSQSNLISGSLCERLNLSQECVDISIIGVNQVVSDIKKKVQVTILSLQNGYRKEVSCLVVPQISESIPSRNVDVSRLKFPNHVRLADPGFSKKGKVDILLGADIFYGLLCMGQISLGNRKPILQNTHFGWVVSGSVVPGGKGPVVRCNLNVNIDLQRQLEQFWVIEEPPSLENSWSEEDRQCEQHFVETTQRCKDGRFMVQIPLLGSPTKLGDSRTVALKQFLSLERKLAKNSQLKERYHNFMEEYKTMGHMSIVSSSLGERKVEYFLPHHGVLNEDSLTTKLRVVFNGSSPTDSGVSFNDLQYKGPTIQDDLLSILLRFREYNVVVCADISKMYRMVLVDEGQRSLQKIFWRSCPEEEVAEYTLNTVTYGTKSAPFLAVRCLAQLGLENRERYPKAANTILHNFYVDDMLSGAATKDEAVQLCNEVKGILESGCFVLRKWVSNDPQVLETISSGCKVSNSIIFGDKDNNKTLGLLWGFKLDVLMYKIDFPSNIFKMTKRSMLSDISKIFDPLGLLGPCVILAKIQLQKLWLLNLGWDEILPGNIHHQWRDLKRQLESLNTLEIPRHVLCSHPVEIQIHGFSDASMDSYGGCVYLRSVDVDGTIKVRLMSSKVKVSPLKVVTIPRLELCGALVMVKLVAKLQRSMNSKCNKLQLWSDSTVVLNWIAKSPNLLQTFVGNRVSQIQNLSKSDQWFHVKSEDNPADVLSRGVPPDKLGDCELWWNGPKWLSLKEDVWPLSSVEQERNLPELRKTQICQTVQINHLFPFSRFSSLCRLKRTLAWDIRFIENYFLSPEDPKSGSLSAAELKKSLMCLCRMAQQECFSKDILNLKVNKQFYTKGLLSLNPFVDETGLLRVGGRLQMSDFDYEKRHPLLLSSKHHLTYLLFEAEYIRLLHAGPQLLLASIRENYWPLGGRNLARKVVSKCVKCFKAKPKGASQIMGVLPETRVRPMPPFFTTGVDYAGPFNIKDKPGRGAKVSKCYVCLFVCFSTRALHLELVSSLTTEAFIASFRRFTSRRGKPNIVYSDNGLNFVGANTELQKLGEFLRHQGHSLSESFANEGITWQFIPAHSPNFGGLWEAGVKACKYHLKRVVSIEALTFEQFSTLLTQVEAALNSRPLVPLSPSPDDFDVLTPSHFLIGKRLTSLPDPDLRELPTNQLSKYQHIQMMLQHFWARWSKEYITELQHRSKWQKEKAKLKVGQLVLVREDNLPPLQWRLGRVVTVILGPDEKPRVAIIKTSNGDIKRSLSKLCPLPIQ